MATDNSKPADAASKPAPTASKKAKKQRNVIIDPRILIVGGAFVVAVIFAIVIGVRTFKGPAYPSSPEGGGSRGEARNRRGARNNGAARRRRGRRQGTFRPRPRPRSRQEVMAANAPIRVLAG